LTQAKHEKSHEKRGNKVVREEQPNANSRRSRLASRPLFPSLCSLFALALIHVSPAAAQVRSAVPLITSITLDNQNVFDSTDHSLPARVQNLLHARTRAGLIRREFLFHVGEPYDSARVAETERNLRRLGTFKQVSIDTVRSDSAWPSMS